MYPKKYFKSISPASVRRTASWVLWTMALLALFASPPQRDNGLVIRAHAQIKSGYNQGAAQLSLILRRLQTTASVLHTAAHPDDENSALLATLARGKAMRVAYLSLTRGEGGQNIIGSDLFEALGVIRTEELLQARTLDGAQQLFTRAVDFGYTTSREETAEKWNDKEVLRDLVRAIRTFRPMIIISRFSGTPSDGHGQHQMAGFLTPLAFRVAADPGQFPEQLSEGLHPWQALKLYLNEGFAATTGNVRIQTGDYDPLIGRTYSEIAMEGRSQHKTQEMGAPEIKGPQTTGMRLIESKTQARLASDSSSGDEIFDGIDTSISGIAILCGVKETAIIENLKEAQASATQALAGYSVFAPEKLVDPLIAGLLAVRSARNALSKSTIRAEAREEANFLLKIKEEEFTRGLQLAAGIDLDVLTNSETIAAGEQLGVTVRVFNNARSNNIVVRKMRLATPPNWKIEQSSEPDQSSNTFRFFRETAWKSATFHVTVPENAAPTMPYWLTESSTEKHHDSLYIWPVGAAKLKPFAPPLIEGIIDCEIAGVNVSFSSPAQFRQIDPVRGELRRELNVVPAITLQLDSQMIVLPAHRTTHQIPLNAVVKNNSHTAIDVVVKLKSEPGIKITPLENRLHLEKGEQAQIPFNLNIPPGIHDYIISGEAVAGQKTYTSELRKIDYPHIQTHRIYRKAHLRLRSIDLKVAPVKIGYIAGSGDGVPEAISRIGIDMTMIDDDDLARGDLARFDSIVIGIRAYEVRPALVANNNRLLDYARTGGTLIVQYQRPDYVTRNLSPYPAQMQARVHDETAPVKLLEPQSPIFSFPNKITDEDWNGWVQERSLYNFKTFDRRYVPLLESHDKDDGEQTGGEVMAKVGRGNYIYTSYSWFRQLPAGVSGAYRLFANLLSLPKAEQKGGKNW